MTHEPAPEPGSLEDEAVSAVEAAETAPRPGSERDLDADLVEEDPQLAGETDEGGDQRLSELEQALIERTHDLQRLQAEYVNYKRRVERDRELVKQNATWFALAPITEVLDTIDRAREHGELEGGLKSVAEQLERVVAAAGLAKFGAAGDAFDPTLHEALSTVGEDPEVVVTTVQVVATSGYKIGGRVVRAAQVLTVEPVGG